MANTILTPSIIAKEALMVLRNNAVMAGLVHRDYSSDFVGSVGDTITVRKPASFTAKEFSSAISVQDATETGVTVKMDKHLDVSFAVTSKEMTLDIADFSQQLLVPAMQAFADKIDGYLIELAGKKSTKNKMAGASMAVADIVKARKALNDNAAPLSERRFVVSTQAEADLLQNELFIAADKVGDAGTALREASLGRKFGFDIYVDQNVGTDDIAFHKNAFALVTRPIALPLGVDNAAIVNYDGFGLRVVYGYDLTSKKNTVSIDMLCGVAVLDENLYAIVDETPAETEESGKGDV